MKYILWPALILGALGSLFAVIGWLLPVAHVASRTATVAADPEAVFRAVHDVGAYPRWRTDVTTVDVLGTEGDHLRFREHSKHGAILMEVVEANPPATLVTRIADPDEPFGGTWTFEIKPATNGSEITITERGEVYNPLFRFMAKFVFGHHATIDRYLADLGAHVAAR